MKLTKKLVDLLLKELLSEIAEKCKFEFKINTHGMDLWIFGSYENFFLHILKGETSAGQKFASFCLEHGTPGNRKAILQKKFP